MAAQGGTQAEGYRILASDLKPGARPLPRRDELLAPVGEGERPIKLALVFGAHSQSFFLRTE